MVKVADRGANLCLHAPAEKGMETASIDALYGMEGQLPILPDFKAERMLGVTRRT